MRATILLTLAVLTLISTGCASGFRLGGDRVGAGVGGYVGPVPDAVRDR